MVLADDNFASIVSAVEEGRGVYANIKKFIAYIFTSNTPEAVPFILFAFSGGRIPLAMNIMQILSIDLAPISSRARPGGRTARAGDHGTAAPQALGARDHPGAPRAGLPVLGLIQSAAAMAAFYFLFWTNGYRGRWMDLPSHGPLYQAATAMTLAAVVMTQVGTCSPSGRRGNPRFRAGGAGTGSCGRESARRFPCSS